MTWYKEKDKFWHTEHGVGGEKLEREREEWRRHLREAKAHKGLMDGRIPIFVDIGQIDLHITHIYTARFVCDIMIYRTTDILIYFTTDILNYCTTERINS